MILGESIVKHVNGWQLSKLLKNEKASVLSFSGASSKQMMIYVKPTIEEKPDFIILHTADPEEVANNLVDVAVSCKGNGLELVVPAILPLRDKLNETGTVANEKTIELCLEKNNYFLEHQNFNPKYHLNGSKLKKIRKMKL